MKKMTAILTAILMMMAMVLYPLQVYAEETNEYILPDDCNYPFSLEILGKNDESCATAYIFSAFGFVSNTTLSIYGQSEVTFRVRAKAGVSVKVIRFAEYDFVEDLEERFIDIEELTPGKISEAYEVTEGDFDNEKNNFLVEYVEDGTKYYGKLRLNCYSADYFILHMHEGTEYNPIEVEVLGSETDTLKPVTVHCSISNLVQFSVVPAPNYTESFDVKLNGHMNTGREVLAEGDNYFTLEYKGKKFNLVLRRPETAEWSNPFTDVDTDDAFFSGVKYCNMNGLMLGTSDTMFTPDAITTRAMVVTTLYRIAGSPDIKGENKFKDVEKGSWYYNAVTWANENNIVLGYDNGNFGTDDNITREQFATIMYRYAKTLQPELTVNFYKYPYSENDVAEYARDPMKWAIKFGMLKTVDTINLNAKQEVTRADLAMGIAGLNTFIHLYDDVNN